MKFERMDQGGPKRTSDSQARQAARKRIAQRRIRSLVIWLLVVAALAVFYVSGGKQLLLHGAQKQWQSTKSTREGGKAAGGLFQRGSVKAAEKEFDENK
jgi:hypothetical protein